MLLNAAKSQLITFTLQKSVHSVPITVKDIITESKSSIKAVYSTNIEDGQNQIHSTSSSKMQNIAMQQEFFLQILLILISFFCTWSNLALQALIGENKINIYLSIYFSMGNSAGDIRGFVVEFRRKLLGMPLFSVSKL